jgi:accessory gene regulator protein AgrB
MYTMKYIPGKDNPTDYASRHPLPVESFSELEKSNMIMDEDDELCISRIITSDIPDAVTLEMVQKSISLDPISVKLIDCIKKGYIDGDFELKPLEKYSTS